MASDTRVRRSVGLGGQLTAPSFDIERTDSFTRTWSISLQPEGDDPTASRPHLADMAGERTAETVRLP
jgi:hypothetical protein